MAADDRRDDVLDERGDDRAERGADDDRNCKVQDVAAENERLEIIDQTSHAEPSPELAGWRPATLPELSHPAMRAPEGNPQNEGDG